jgi:hypothetical protein
MMFLPLHQGNARLVLLVDLDTLMRVAQLREEVDGPEDFGKDLINRCDLQMALILPVL